MWGSLVACCSTQSSFLYSFFFVFKNTVDAKTESDFSFDASNQSWLDFARSTKWKKKLKKEGCIARLCRLVPAVIFPHLLEFVSLSMTSSFCLFQSRSCGPLCDPAHPPFPLPMTWNTPKHLGLLLMHWLLLRTSPSPHPCRPLTLQTKKW